MSEDSGLSRRRFLTVATSITGGVGVQNYGEGFAEAYFLPNYRAYCETCASIGMAFWNHRLALLHRLLHALFNRRDELLRDGAAEDLVAELEAGTAAGTTVWQLRVWSDDQQRPAQPVAVWPLPFSESH